MSRRLRPEELLLNRIFYGEYDFVPRNTTTGEQAGIDDVIFNNPATIAKWSDGTKTVVKCAKEDTYSKSAGLALCIMKKLYGDNFHSELNYWLNKREDKNNGTIKDE